MHRVREFDITHELTLRIWERPGAESVIAAELVGKTGAHCAAGAYHPDVPVEIALVGHPANPQVETHELLAAAASGDKLFRGRS